MRHARHILAGATLLATPLPFALESWAREAIADATARCSDGTSACGEIESLSLDAGGLHVGALAKTTRGFEIRADAIEVRPTWEGLEVHVEALALRRVATPRAAAVQASTPPAETTGDPPPARVDTKGIPVRVVARGTQTIEQRGVRLQVHDPVLEIAADGSLRASFDADVRRGELWATSTQRLRAEPVSGLDRWSVEGGVVVADGAPLRLRADVRRSQLVVDLAAADGGSLHVRAELDGAPTLELAASGFRPAVLGSLAAGTKAGVRFDLRDAALDGAATIVRSAAHGWSVEVPTLLADGVVLEHPALARDPVTLGSLLVSGRGSIGTAGIEGIVDVEHDGVAAHVEARRDAKHLQIAARLPTTSCQALVDALPDGMAGTIRGSRLEGEIEGALDLEVRFAELPDWERRLAEDPEDPGPPPGHLEIAFPFLEKCRMLADPPDVDFAALRGAYRHTFVDGTGRRRTRVMAAGADGFVPLWRVPLVAGAFVTLEDTHFRSHDGFDRRQLANALWHNFRVGGISRGASTITQQTARNLFLGIDRSVGRKLQEALLTARLEAELPKTRILELYLNIIELGPGVHGIEEAAQYHFGKSAWQLDVVQAIHLAMLAPAPHRYSERFASGKVDAAWDAELRAHVKRLWFHGLITEDQMLHALWDDLDLVPR